MMNSVFEPQNLEVSYHWTTIPDIERSTIEQWKQMANGKGINVSDTRMSHRINRNKIEEALQKHIKMIENVQSEVSKLLECMLKPYVFVLTDLQGIVLSVYAWGQLADMLDSDKNFGMGTSFAMEHAGVNAISMAIELEECVYIRGSEHDLELFSTWNCLCGPLRIGEKIIGYLDMSFADSEDLILAGTMFEHLLRRISENLVNLCPVVKREYIYNEFNSFKLSPREKEVGYSWLMNHSTLQMAKEMDIAEGTVRNMLKKVYIKTGVHDKGQFFRRFL